MLDFKKLLYTISTCFISVAISLEATNRKRKFLDEFEAHKPDLAAAMSGLFLSKSNTFDIAFKEMRMEADEVYRLLSQAIPALETGWINQDTGENSLHLVLNHRAYRKALNYLHANYRELFNAAKDQADNTGETPRQKADRLGYLFPE